MVYYDNYQEYILPFDNLETFENIKKAILEHNNWVPPEGFDEDFDDSPVGETLHNFFILKHATLPNSFAVYCGNRVKYSIKNYNYNSTNKDPVEESTFEFFYEHTPFIVAWEPTFPKLGDWSLGHWCTYAIRYPNAETMTYPGEHSFKN